MKLVLKYTNELKLYAEAFDYHTLKQFVEEQFNLDAKTIELTFVDDQEDTITIHSTDDLQVLRTIFDGKEYVKVNVEGTIKAKTPEELIDIKPASNEEEPIEKEGKGRRGHKRWKKWQDKPRSPKGQRRHSPKRRSESSSPQKEDKREKPEFGALVHQLITKLVDQRLKTMFPSQKGKTEEKDNTSEADLIKQFEQLFRKMNRRSHRHHGHHHRGNESSSSKDKCHRKWRGHHYMKKLWGLAYIFGGEPEQYKSFVEENEDLRPRQTFKKWAEDHQIPKEEFHEKLATMRCQRLSRCFGKQPEYYKEFVTANIQLGQKELMNSLFEKGIVKKEERSRCWWGGRFFNFNEACKPSEGKPQKEEKPVQQDKPCQKQQKKIQKEQKKEIDINPSMLEQPKPLDPPEIVRKKGAILIKMNDIFGKEGIKDYMKFIDQHFSIGEELIIPLWLETKFHKA